MTRTPCCSFCNPCRSNSPRGPHQGQPWSADCLPLWEIRRSPHLLRGARGPIPLMLKPKKAQKLMMLIKAAPFLQIGHLSGSLGLSDGCGTKTTSVPFRCEWPVLTAARAIVSNARHGARNGKPVTTQRRVVVTRTFYQLYRAVAVVKVSKSVELHLWLICGQRSLFAFEQIESSPTSA